MPESNDEGWEEEGTHIISYSKVPVKKGLKYTLSGEIDFDDGSPPNIWNGKEWKPIDHELWNYSSELHRKKVKITIKLEVID